VPSYNGLNIFGRAVHMRPAKRQRAEQRLEAPGINGQGTLDMGFRGRTWHVSGVLFGIDGPSLRAAITLFESADDGHAYTLVDTYGAAWPFVKLEEIQISSDPRLDFYRGYFVQYSATFHQLREG
jgi:hypothetical protein